MAQNPETSFKKGSPWWEGESSAPMRQPDVRQVDPTPTRPNLLKAPAGAFALKVTTPAAWSLPIPDVPVRTDQP